MHLKHLHTPAEKYVGLIVSIYFCTDLVGNIMSSFNEVVDMNTMLVTLIKDVRENADTAGQIFLGCIFQAVLMSRWNLAWIFLDVALDSSFHRASAPITSKDRRESSGAGLMTSILAREDLSIISTNFIEVWIVAFCTSFCILQLWLPD